MSTDDQLPTPTPSPAASPTSPRRRALAYLAIALVLAALLVLLRGPIAAWFTGAPMGGRSSEAVSTRAGDLTIEAALTPDPPRQQGNALLLTVLGPDGRPVEGAHVEVEATMPAMGAMPEMRSRAEVIEEGPGRFRAGFDLAMAGTWTLETDVRSKLGTAAARWTMTVGSSGLTPVGGSGPSGAHDHSGQGAAAAAGTLEGTPTIEIDTGRLQEIGVRSGVVERRPLAGEIRAVGRVTFDETHLTDVTVRFGGFIEDLRVAETGQWVGKGQTLFTLYSPELYAAQREYLVALAGQRAARGTSAPDRADYLVRAARQKLRLWELSEAQIRQLEESREPLENVPVASPASGYVIEKEVVEGAAVEPGMRLYRLAGLDRVWVEAEVYESELPRVRIGQEATVTLPYLPGQSFRGHVMHVHPMLEAESRTGVVRIELANRRAGGQLQLKPDMFADVTLAAEERDALVVPESAVLYTGPRRLVFVDLGGGRFRPQEVEVGTRADGWVEVTAGLAEGDRVVTSGNFLIAAESRLQSATELW